MYTGTDERDEDEDIWGPETDTTGDYDQTDPSEDD